MDGDDAPAPRRAQPGNTTLVKTRGLTHNDAELEKEDAMSHQPDNRLKHFKDRIGNCSGAVSVPYESATVTDAATTTSTSNPWPMIFVSENADGQWT